MNEPTVIVVPVWDADDQSQYTISFIQQMQMNDSPNWKVCIVDNASESLATQGFLANLDDERFHVIANTENVGYGRAANLGAKWGIENGAEYIVVLNNDVVFLQDGWLEDAFLAHLRDHKDWLMGARYIDFNAGTAYDGKNMVAYLEGWCLVCHKDLWLDISGFSDDIWLWHEDVELCIRAEKKGYTLKQSPAFHWITYSDCDNPPIHHLYGRTGFKRLGNQFEAISEQSKQIVISKHFANNN